MRTPPLRFLPVRAVLALMLTGIVLPAAAQTRPADLQPLPEPPPPPGMVEETPLEPQVTIKRRGADQVEEYRVNGKLYMIKITPPHGTPYYLIDPKGDGGFIRDDQGIGDRKLAVPMWVIRSF